MAQAVGAPTVPQVIVFPGLIVFPGRRFGVSSLSALPRLLRSLTAVAWRHADAVIESARDQDWARYQRGVETLGFTHLT